MDIKKPMKNEYGNEVTCFDVATDQTVIDYLFDTMLNGSTDFDTLI